MLRLPVSLFPFAIGFGDFLIALFPAAELDVDSVDVLPAAGGIDAFVFVEFHLFDPLGLDIGDLLVEGAVLH